MTLLRSSSRRRQADSLSFKRGCLLGASVIAFATLMGAGAASAQSTTDKSNQTLGEIVVTARSRAEKLQNVPLAITAISGAQLSQASAISLQDISFLTPGLVFSSFGAEANENLVIRGISDTSGGEASATNVAVFLDGVYIANPSAVDLSVGGLERVEVVEGPVSGLYGRNAFAGAINYVTQKPTDAFHFNIAETAGSDGKQQVDAGISGTIIPGVVKGRIAGTYDTFNGTYHDGVTGQSANGHNRKDWMATLVITPLPNLTITPVLYSGQDFFAPNATVTYAQNCAFTTGNSYCGNLGKNQLGPYEEPADASGATGLTRKVIHFHLDTKYTGAYGNIDVLFGFNKVNTQSYSNFDGQQFGLLDNYYAHPAGYVGPNPVLGQVYAPNRYGNQASENDTSVEVRYDTPSNLPYRFSTGAYYLNQNRTNAGIYGIDLTNVPAGDYLHSAFDYTAGGQPDNLGVSSIGTYDLSYFVGGDWDILPNLTASSVVRNTKEQTVEDEAGGAPKTTLNNATFWSVTSNESLTWKVTPNFITYFGVANGSKAGGFNGTSVTTGSYTFAPETDWNYELGVKTTWLDGHLRLNGDIFHEDISNVQQICPQANSISLVVCNEGSVSETGFEANGSYSQSGFKLSAGVTYSPARFSAGSDYNEGLYSTNDVIACQALAYCAGRVVTPPTVAPPGVTPPPYIKLKGLQLPNSSDFVFNTTAEYRHPLPVSGISALQDVEWFVRADYRFESREYATVINNAWYGPRNVINLHAGLDGALPVGRWSITAYVLNLLDDKTPEGEAANAGYDLDGSPLFSGRPTQLQSGFIQWIPTAVLPDGRTFAVKLEYKY